MNWKDIKEKYLKAFTAWEEFSWWFMYLDDEDRALHIEGIGVDHANCRDLYDFFDGEGIRCFMLYNSLNGKFKPEIWMKKSESEIEGTHDWHMNRVGFINCEATRTEAETALFTKAFELLDSTLPV